MNYTVIGRRRKVTKGGTIHMNVKWKASAEQVGNQLILTDGKQYFSSEVTEEVKALLAADHAFTGKCGNARVYTTLDGKAVRKTIVAGIANFDGDLYKLRKAIATAGRLAEQEKVGTVTVQLTKAPEGLSREELAEKIAEVSMLSTYAFTAYKEEQKPAGLTELVIAGQGLESAVARGHILGEATLIARNLVNHPANVMLPDQLAAEAVKVGDNSGIAVDVYLEDKINEIHMPAYMEVAKASANRPRLIVMNYAGNPENPDEKLGLVGKGLTFDTGGYSLKPKNSMISMKSDMGGSAAVIGAMSAIAKAGLKVNVVAVVAACENMMDGSGYRPGDIIQSRGGKSIFIQSTDAEGRLTLIDAVDYAIKDLKVTRVVDIATLTGSCLHALGHTTTGAVTNDQKFYKTLEKAADASQERIWLMPSHPEFKELIKHREADLTNATSSAGMITAGLFIGEFVGDTPWIHMDIAGTSWTEKKTSESQMGGTGAGVRTLFRLAENLQG